MINTLNLKDEFHYPLEGLPLWALLDCEDKIFYKKEKEIFLKIIVKEDDLLEYILDRHSQIWRLVTS